LNKTVITIALAISAGKKSGLSGRHYHHRPTKQILFVGELAQKKDRDNNSRPFKYD